MSPKSDNTNPARIITVFNLRFTNTIYKSKRQGVNWLFWCFDFTCSQLSFKIFNPTFRSSGNISCFCHVHIVVGPGTGTRDRQNQKNIEQMKKSTSQQVLGRTKYFSKKYKDHNDRIAKIHRFERSLDQSSLKIRVISRNLGNKNVFITRY